VARFRTYTINGSGVVNGTGERLQIGFIAQAWYNFLGQVTRGGPLWALGPLISADPLYKLYSIYIHIV
jgi:hypothetical protein